MTEKCFIALAIIQFTNEEDIVKVMQENPSKSISISKNYKIGKFNFSVKNFILFHYLFLILLIIIEQLGKY